MKNIMIILLFIALAACSSIKTNWDYNPDVNFNQYRTYSWALINNDASSYHVEGLQDQRIRNAVDDQMAELGMIKIPNPNKADLKVNYITKVVKKYNLDRYNGGFGYNSYYRPGRNRAVGWGFGRGYSTRVRSYDVGTLFIDFVDVRDDQLIWRGSASNIIKRNQSPRERIEEVDEVVAKILSNYPPEYDSY